MFEHQKRVEIERRILKANDERAKAGLPPADLDSLRLIAADELERELEASRQTQAAQRMAASQRIQPQAAATRAATPVVRQVKAKTPPPAKPLPRPLAAAKPPVPPHIAAERARVSAIIAEAPVGAEGERDEAISAGVSVGEFRNMLAARAILDARRQAAN